MSFRCVINIDASHIRPDDDQRKYGRAMRGKKAYGSVYLKRDDGKLVTASSRASTWTAPRSSRAPSTTSGTRSGSSMTEGPAPLIVFRVEIAFRVSYTRPRSYGRECRRAATGPQAILVRHRLF